MASDSEQGTEGSRDGIVAVKVALQPLDRHSLGTSPDLEERNAPDILERSLGRQCDSGRSLVLSATLLSSRGETISTARAHPSLPGGHNDARSDSIFILIIRRGPSIETRM